MRAFRKLPASSGIGTMARAVGRISGFSAAITLISLLSLGSASASTAGFSVVGGPSYLLPTGAGTAGFDPGSWNSGTNGFGGGSFVNEFTSFAPGEGLFITNGTATTPLNVTFTFTYLGTEAGYTNAAYDDFSYAGTPLFLNHGTGSNTYGDTSAPMSFVLGTNPALVPFSFQSFGGSTHAVNGGAVSSQAAMAFYFDPTNPLTVFLLFDDSGAGPDKDFDDMVIRIDAQFLTGGSGGTTPIPAALPLFATGLGALGLLGWRRKKKAQAVAA